MNTVSSKTWIPVSAGVTACTACIAVTLWVSSRFSDSDARVNAQLNTMSEDIRFIRDEMQRSQAAQSQSWTNSRMEAWLLRLQLNNSSLAVPAATGDGLIR